MEVEYLSSALGIYQPWSPCDSIEQGTEPFSNFLGPSPSSGVSSLYTPLLLSDDQISPLESLPPPIDFPPTHPNFQANFSAIHGPHIETWTAGPMSFPYMSKAGGRKARKSSKSISLKPGNATVPKKRHRKTQSVGSRHSRKSSLDPGILLDWQGMGVEGRLLQHCASPQEPSASQTPSSMYLKFSAMNRMRSRSQSRMPSAEPSDGTTAMDGVMNVQPPAASNGSWSTQPHEPGIGYWTPAVSESQSWTKPPQLPQGNARDPSQALLPLETEQIPDLSYSQSSPSESSPIINLPKSIYDDCEEDRFAFLHPENEGNGYIPDDPEEVYCDFGAVFDSSPTLALNGYGDGSKKPWFEGSGIPF